MCPLVSVIVPCFRQGHLLPLALDSILKQTYKNIEVIVINDGSDDNTDEVVQVYLKRIRYISQTNSGLPSARNVGIDAARGKYLHFLDSDDQLHLEAIENLVRAADGRSDVLVAGGWRVFSESVDKLFCPQRFPDQFPQEGPLLPRIIHNNLGPPNVYLSCAEMVRQVGKFSIGERGNLATNEVSTGCEDWDLWMRLAIAHARFIAVPQLVAYYRTSAGSMSSNFPRMLANRSESLLRACDRFFETPALLQTAGQDMCDAVARIRRRVKVQIPGSRLLARLSQALDRLEQNNLRPTRGRRESQLIRLLGRDRAEDWILLYYKRFDSPIYDFYKRGIA